MTNSKHANNKIKDVLVLGQGLIQKIDDKTIYAEKMYSPNFNIANKTFCLSLHCNGDYSYLFVNDREVIKFKAKKQLVVKILLLETSQLILIKQTENQQGFMDIFMILVLTIMLFQMIKYTIFMLI